MEENIQSSQEVPDQSQQTPVPTSIEIFSPINGKGLGREYHAAPEPIDESNYIYIGAILRDQNGNLIENVVMEITATDSSQNKTLNGTGTFSPKINGKYYPFNYEFHTSGTHVITFSVGQVSKSITLEVL